MNHHPPRRTATSALLLAAALCIAGAAAAAPAAGTVAQLSGPLLAQKADGRTKALAAGSIVEAGDTLLTGADSYAEVRFADRGAVTLKPDTRLAIDAFSYDEARAEGDRMELTLVHGGLKVASGAVGARSSGRYKLATPLGSIAVGNSTFIVQYTAPAAVAALSRVHVAALSSALVAGGTLSDAPALVIGQLTPVPGLLRPTSSSLPPGLYVSVIDGIIDLSNKGGSLSFNAGQFGYTANISSPPIIVPSNPGLQFTPPPTFASSSSNTSAGSGKPGTVDCEVR